MEAIKQIVGFTAGNFDLLHPGYIYTFEEAKKHCDHFLVFLQEDPSLHRKSKYKPAVLTEAYLRFATHYRFNTQVCNPRSGNEKGSVEILLGKYLAENSCNVVEQKARTDIRAK